MKQSSNMVLIKNWGKAHPGTGDLERGLARFVGLTLEAAGQMNLTSDREPELFWQRHIEDALIGAEKIERALGAAEGWRVLDVGSGAGLPGLVWAMLWPASRIDLLEARRKRVEHLRKITTALDLNNVRMLEGRAEMLG